MNLEDYLKELKVDEIEDDEEFCEAEHDAVLNYCEEREFILSEEDLSEVKARALYISFEDWKDMYENEMCDGSTIATIDVDDYTLLGAMRNNNIPITKDNFLKCERFLQKNIEYAMPDLMQDCVDDIIGTYKNAKIKGGNEND